MNSKPARRGRLVSALGSVVPLIVLAVALSGCESLWPVASNPYTTIHPSTDFGEYTQHIYAMITYWTLAVWVAVFILLGYVLFRFRDDGAPGNPKQIHGNAQLEFAWTLIPVMIVVAISVPTIRTIFKIGDAAPAGALEVKVVGRRWWWEFSYLKDGVVTANEMHLPVGTPISLAIESDTVIHSFWAPRLGGKRDAVPGRINRIWFTIKDEVKPGDQPIEYLGECAEFCGEEHARMRFRVYGESPEGYAAWIKKMQTPAEIPADVKQKGEELFSSAGCAGCHTIVGNQAATGKIGPNLTHFADRHSVGAGAALFDTADHQMMSDEDRAKILSQWLHDPDSIKPGTTKTHNESRSLDGMNIPRPLSDDEINSLVAYLLAQK